MAMWLANAFECHLTGSRPIAPSQVFTMPYWSPNMFEKISATATGAMT